MKLAARVLLIEDVAAEPHPGEKLLALALAWVAPVSGLERALGRLQPGSLDDLATVIFSSGSTGVPKGVALSHYNIVSNAEQLGQAFDFGPQDMFLGILPFFVGRFVSLEGFNLWSAIMWALMVWVRVSVAQMLWKVNPEAWIFLTVIAVFNFWLLISLISGLERAERRLEISHAVGCPLRPVSVLEQLVDVEDHVTHHDATSCWPPRSKTSYSLRHPRLVVARLSTRDAGTFMESITPRGAPAVESVWLNSQAVVLDALHESHRDTDVLPLGHEPRPLARRAGLLQPAVDSDLFHASVAE